MDVKSDQKKKLNGFLCWENKTDIFHHYSTISRMIRIIPPDSSLCPTVSHSLRGRALVPPLGLFTCFCCNHVFFLSSCFLLHVHSSVVFRLTHIPNKPSRSQCPVYPVLVCLSWCLIHASVSLLGSRLHQQRSG